MALVIDSSHTTGAQDIAAFTDGDLLLVEDGSGDEKLVVDKLGFVTLSTVDDIGEVIKAIKKVTGIKFNITESLLEGEVSADFKKLPLLEGIKKIIYPLNYAIIYNRDDEISKVIILDKVSGSRSCCTETFGYLQNNSIQGKNVLFII
ncbi:MAG: hypothetical protein GY941_01875 [Planctomycetes bacterium]|nr:hypothetical protein [Planctomycetota bacterium]